MPTDNRNRKIVFNKANLKLGLNYLLGGCYCTVGISAFRKLVDTLIGLDPAPFMINLFLHSFQSKWILNLKKSNVHKAWILVLLVTCVSSI